MFPSEHRAYGCVDAGIVMMQPKTKMTIKLSEFFVCPLVSKQWAKHVIWGERARHFICIILGNKNRHLLHLDMAAWAQPLKHPPQKQRKKEKKKKNRPAASNKCSPLLPSNECKGRLPSSDLWWYQAGNCACDLLEPKLLALSS